MSVENLKAINKNGGVEKSEKGTSTVKCFEVSTNLNEIITIKNEPQDFVDFPRKAVVDASANPLFNIHKKSSVVSSSNCNFEENLIIRYPTQKYDTAEKSNIDAQIYSDKEEYDQLEWDWEDEKEHIDIIGYDRDSGF